MKELENSSSFIYLLELNWNYVNIIMKLINENLKVGEILIWEKSELTTWCSYNN